MPSNRPKVIGGKCAKRKALQHFIHGDEQPPEAEPDDAAVKAAMNQFRATLADGVTRRRAEAQEHKANDPER